MKSVLEEYGIFIVEFICAVIIMGILMMALAKFDLLAEFIADKLLGGA